MYILIISLKSHFGSLYYSQMGLLDLVFSIIKSDFQSLDNINAAIMKFHLCKFIVILVVNLSSSLVVSNHKFACSHDSA